ncbi:MAG: ATP-grasp fold amidoligase family protein [Anaerovoracaceae bacterium]|nr:ATP-grasp fold amidoligase family protein [Anaerovoracaceae bacterium]
MLKWLKKKIRKFTVKVMKKCIKWYKADTGKKTSGNKKKYTQKYTHYLLDREGKLTDAKKKEILSEIFKRRLGYSINWNNPITFNAKIMWLKLNYQNPLITRCSDKFAVKDYVDETIGKGHVVPTIDWWTDPDDIDFEKLPEQFVLKVNWSSGFNIIIKDKSEIDEEQIRKQLRKWTRSSQNSYYQMFNWGYKYMSPVIYAEEYISEVGDSEQVFDYKFFCYDGVCKNLFITTDRFSNKTYNWFDRDFNELPFTYGNAGKTPGGVEKPKHFEEMIDYAEQLAKPFPFVRVDFYEIGDKVLVGEMTFYSGGGILQFKPRLWDIELGKLINLPDPMYFDELRKFEVMEPKDAYLMEDKITLQEKQHYCEQKGFAQLHYWPNLKTPRSYNEKILWLALHYKNPLIAQCTDKWEMKKYVAEKIGKQYVVPPIAVYEDLNDIVWDELPQKFVAKSTAGWGNKQVKIVKKKEYMNESVFKASVAEWLYPWNTYYYNNMCITDEKIKPRIIFEELLGDGEDSIMDYKFYCSYGKVNFALVVADRNGKKQKRAFMDVETWEPLPVRRRGVHKASHVEKPEQLSEMLEIARKLSEDIPMVRVDLYNVDGNIYVGEMTFSPGLFLRLEPVEWDYKMGGFIDLDKIEQEYLI